MNSMGIPGISGCQKYQSELLGCPGRAVCVVTVVPGDRAAKWVGLRQVVGTQVDGATGSELCLTVS